MKLYSNSTTLLDHVSVAFLARRSGALTLRLEEPNAPIKEVTVREGDVLDLGVTSWAVREIPGTGSISRGRRNGETNDVVAVLEPIT